MALDVDSNQPLSAYFQRAPATPRSTEPPSRCVMTFVLQPWQLLLSILAGWINDEQQKRIEYLRTENQVLREKVGKKRILLETINAAAWPSKARSWAARHWRRSVRSSRRTPFCAGIGSWWPRSGTTATSVVQWAGQQRRRKSSI